MGLHVLFLSLILWVGGLCEDYVDDVLQQRRLKEFARHIQILEQEPDLLDEQGHTPILQLGELQLRHVFTVNRERPWLLAHAEFSEEYHARRRLRDKDGADRDGQRDKPRIVEGSRRLAGIESDLLTEITATPFVFRTPRDRVRLFAALHGAALPEAAYTNASLNYWGAGGKVHSGYGQMMFTKNRTDINDASLTGGPGYSQLHTGGWTPTSMGNNFSGNADDVGNAYRDGQALRGARAKIHTAATARAPGWKQDEYLGLRLKPCDKKTQNEPRCWLDAGVALSVYEETQYTVIVFHSDWSINWYEYILWQNRAWIIDEMENQVKNQWTIDARQPVTPTMQSRKGSTYDENQERCAFKDQQNLPINDMTHFAKTLDITESSLQQFGYWLLVKRMMRLILPETRDRVAERARTIYLTGSGFGGVWAALTSMWLRKADDATYDTYVIAGGGFECLARSLQSDMRPWDKHTQVKVYAHVMDIYSRMDFVSGYVCLYGLRNMTMGSDVHTFCSGMIGFSGPQLAYRGKPVGEYQSSSTRAAVAEGRLNFDACHYYTHSPWYAAMLFISDLVLMADGTTDGGCQTKEPIPQVDQLGRCPTAARVEADCEAIASTTQELPVTAMIAVASGLACFICFMGCVGYMALQRVRNDLWMFGTDKQKAQKHSGGFCSQCKALFGCGMEIRKQKKDRKKGDRAKIARERAKQARLNKMETSKEKRSKKKKKSAHDSVAADEAEWQNLKDKLEVDVSQIGKADEDITQAANLLGLTKSAVAPGAFDGNNATNALLRAELSNNDDEGPKLETSKKGSKDDAEGAKSKDESDNRKGRRQDKDRDRDRDRDRNRSERKSRRPDAKRARSDLPDNSTASERQETNIQATSSTRERGRRRSKSSEDTGNLRKTARDAGRSKSASTPEQRE